MSLTKCFEYGMIGKENNLRNSRIRCKIYTGCSVGSRNVVSKTIKKELYACYVAIFLSYRDFLFKQTVSAYSHKRCSK